MPKRAIDTDVKPVSPSSAAIKAVRSLLRMIRLDGPIPPDFWHDPFILGFLFYFIHGVAVQAGEEPDEYEDVPMVYMDLCGKNDGVEVMQRTMVFHMDKNGDYEAGTEAADKILSVVCGLTDYDDDPAVAKARGLAAHAVSEAAEGMRPDLEDITFAYLLELVFLGEMRSRLGIIPQIN